MERFCLVYVPVVEHDELPLFPSACLISNPDLWSLGHDQAQMCPQPTVGWATVGVHFGLAWHDAELDLQLYAFRSNLYIFTF